MFSLIITIISIALVTALALATIYYGGSAFKSGAASAKAAQAILQGQQLTAAADIFHTQQNRWPASIDEMVSLNYLATAPVASLELGLQLAPMAQAGAVQWAMPVAGQPTFTLVASLNQPACQAVNLKTLGKDGILTQAYAGYAAQCYGTSASALTVVVSNVNADLSLALPPAAVATTPLPASDTSPAWFVQPGATSSPVATGIPAAPLPAVAVDHPSVTFPDTAVFFSRNFVVQVTNLSSTGQVFTGVLAGGYASNFTVDSSDCANVVAADYCNLRVSFTPSGTAGDKVATLSVGDKVIPLTAKALPPPVFITMHRGSSAHVNWGDSAYRNTMFNTVVPEDNSTNFPGVIIAGIKPATGGQDVGQCWGQMGNPSTPGYSMSVPYNFTYRPNDDYCYVSETAPLGGALMTISKGDYTQDFVVVNIVP